ncbi:MAG: PQQ-binding-like beta-propeller repeat protein, partial [Planctomycetaceae bacterium]|nr:PQQ-binding-like beta-propeller repeat protein [Planctomycetaceae bacterium]
LFMRFTTGLVRFSMILLLTSGLVRGDDWPQWMGPTRDGTWAETGIVRKLPKTLTPEWSVPVAGGYSGPAVANGKVFVLDYLREEGNAANDPNNRAESKGKERVLCFNAETGKELWKHEYDCTYKISYPCGPRVTPTIKNGKVFTLGAEGDFLVLDEETGKLLWKKNFP